MLPHEEKVVDEWTELVKKISKLDTFIENSPIYSQLPHKDKSLLCKQLSYMQTYANILMERITNILGANLHTVDLRKEL